jgi:transposase
MTLTVFDMSSGDSRSSGVNKDGKSGPRMGQATRRIFGPAYKLAIVAEYDSLTVHGARGALLRREGLYQSHVEKWRRARDRGALDTTGTAHPAGPGKAAQPAVENRRLMAENARLTVELTKSKSVVEVMGKLHALLEALSESAGCPPKSTR